MWVDPLNPPGEGEAAIASICKCDSGCSDLEQNVRNDFFARD